MVGPEAPYSVQTLGHEHNDAIAAVWHPADNARRASIGLPIRGRSPEEVLQRDGAFGVGIFDGDELVCIAIAMPALGDDGRSLVNVPGLAHISSVATLPQRWRRGLALHAMRAIRLRAMRRGYARCQLWTQASNLRAQALYERDGFMLSGRHKVDDFGEDIVHFVRDLTLGAPVARPAARVICVDRSERILLMHWRDPYDGYQLWEPPGGGIEDGESPLLAARREWLEETGLPAPVFVAETQVGRDQFWAGGRIVVDEVFYLARTDADAPPPGAGDFTPVEQVSYLGHAWVTRAQLAARQIDGDPIEPDLVAILQRLDA